MSLIFALTAVASVGAGANAQCVPMINAAADAGLTTLIEASKAVSGLPGAAPLMEAVLATEPVQEPVTVFAPSNEAFAELAEANPEFAMHPELETVLAILLAHVIPGQATSDVLIEAINAAAPDPAVTTTLLGTTIEGELVDGEIFGRPTGADIMAQVVVADVLTCGGVVHVIDKVLVPAFGEDEEDEGEEEDQDEYEDVVEMPAGEYGAYGEAGVYGAY